MPQMKYNEAIRQALLEELQDDPDVILMGLGVPDPLGVFGTTTGLQELFGQYRVMDIPCAENGLNGVAIGLALGGKKVVLSHQRVDFALLSMEQIINQAAKWHFMFSGDDTISIVIRMIIGRGWGQGPQHSQFLPSLFTHIPGLKVFAPVFPDDAKSLLRYAVQDQSPVIFFEHRWLHFIEGDVIEGLSPEPVLERSKIIRLGSDITLVSYSYGVLECLKAAEFLSGYGVEAEVIDLRILRPLDCETVGKSVKKTTRLVLLEHTWSQSSIGAEVIAQLAINGIVFASSPQRLALADYPLPSSPGLAAGYYPGVKSIVSAVKSQLSREDIPFPSVLPGYEEDKPNPTFRGPF